LRDTGKTDQWFNFDYSVIQSLEKGQNGPGTPKWKGADKKEDKGLAVFTMEKISFVWS
jgi:hypothetical protein